MKKKNNKGFSLVEILAVIVLLGILSTIAIASLVKYKQNAKDLDYDALAKSSYHAYESYNLQHNKSIGSKVTLNTLYEEGFIENLKDPGDSNKECVGYVSSSGSLADTNKFHVYLCCSVNNYHYIFGELSGTEKEKEEFTDASQCN